jgi:hypothetical protein
MAREFSAAELDLLAKELNEQGVCVLKGLFERSLIDTWADAFHGLFEDRRHRLGGLAPREKNRYYVTFPFREPFSDPGVFANPAILGVLNRVFAQEYVIVQLAADTPFPGSEYQKPHRDYRPLFTDDLHTPLYAVAVNFPLVDVNELNAPFQMAKGTHRMPRDEALAKLERGEVRLESFPMEKGDVMIRTPLAIHRGTPNRSDHPRPMVVMGYVMHWLHTPKVDLVVDRPTLAGLTEEHKKLLRCEVVDRLPEYRPETYIEFTY